MKPEDLEKYRQAEIEKENREKALMLMKAFALMNATESSNIVQMGYDEENRELFVQFSNKSVYVYFNVVPFVCQKLVNAESLGKEFANLVKKVCPYERLK